MIDRRGTLRFGVALTALLAASGHTPYEQWVVYRRRVLLIGSSRDDPAGYELGRQVAETLALHLPDSRSRVSRAPTAQRLAGLIATDQLDVAVLPWPDAAALSEARPPFDAFGGVALAGLFGFEAHVLACRADFPDRHAYLVSRTLESALGATATGSLMAGSQSAIPVHPGTRDHALGRPVPAVGDRAPEDHDHDHGAGG